ncbi:acyltransferase family protein [Aerococcus urinaeequi]|uniref:acyltransferase family protein n=1 Tax=Aerococcus urinaeequi TaxID=51665 RepID=UPI003AAD7858
MRNKIKKVWLPYFIVTLTWVLIDIFIGRSHGLIPNILSLIGINIYKAVDPTMWYVTFLLLWYFGFYVVFKLRTSLKIKANLLTIAGIGLYVFLQFIVPNIDIIQHYSLCFPIGVFISIYYEGISEYVINNPKNMMILVVVMVILSFIINLFVDRIFLFIVVILGSLAIMIITEYLVGSKNNILEIVGKYSYELYLIEGAFIWKYWDIFSFTELQSVKIVAYLFLITVLATLSKKILTNN